VVSVVAPAGAFDVTLFFRGLGWLATTFRVRFAPDIRARFRYLAGEDARRADELSQALACRQTRAVLVARGGYGCTRLLERVDFSPLANDPKWLVGFSDATALHLIFQRWGLRSLHAHNVTGLGVGDAGERTSWLDALCGKATPRSFVLERLYPGDVSGPLCGGNLAVLCAALAVRGTALPRGGILFLEDVGEAPYRVDRMLVELESRGVFDGMRGVVTGYFSPRQRDVLPVLAEAARRLRLPWLHGLPCGHERPNVPLEFGAEAPLVDNRLTLG
jgi:muramoyltetrapeptide carboxypeptidase